MRSEQLLHQGLGLPEPLAQRGRRRLRHVEGEAPARSRLADLVVELAGQVAPAPPPGPPIEAPGQALQRL